MLKFGGSCVVLLGVYCSSAIGAALHIDDFQTGETTLGWSGGSSPTRIAGGGPAGEGDACLRISAVTGGHLATYSDAADWIGDYDGVDATVVKVDLMSPPTSAALPMRLVLFGPSSIGDRWTSASAQIVPNDGAWRSYAFSLAEADLTMVLGSGTYAQLRASTFRVMLRYNPGTPNAFGPSVESPGGTLNIDNIELATASPPSLPGDFNSDGRIDSDDLDDATLGWKTRFGVDLDGDDFLAWQLNFSPPVATTVSTAAVPEPATTSLLCALVGAALRYGHANRRAMASATASKGTQTNRRSAPPIVG